MISETAAPRRWAAITARWLSNSRARADCPWRFKSCARRPNSRSMLICWVRWAWATRRGSCNCGPKGTPAAFEGSSNRSRAGISRINRTRAASASRMAALRTNSGSCKTGPKGTPAAPRGSSNCRALWAAVCARPCARSISVTARAVAWMPAANSLKSAPNPRI